MGHQVGLVKGNLSCRAIKQWRFLLDFSEGDLDILVFAETRPSETKFSVVFLDSRLRVSH